MKNKVELTDVIAFLFVIDAVMGFVVDGRSYDLGNAEAYRRTVSEYGI